MFVALILTLAFQIFMFVGSNSVIRPANKTDGRLETSILDCSNSFNGTKSIPLSKSSSTNNFFVQLFTISPFWFTFNGASVTFLLSFLLSFILGKKSSDLVLCTVEMRWKTV